MSEDQRKKSPFAKAYVIFGIGAGVGLGLCGVGSAVAPPRDTGLLNSIATVMISTGTALCVVAMWGLFITSLVWIIVAIFKAFRK